RDLHSFPTRRSSDLLVSKFDVRKVLLAIDLDQREVGLLVGAYNLGGIDRTVIGRHLHGSGMVDDVVVGHGIAVGRNEKARAFPGDNFMAMRHAVRAAGTEL